MPVSQRRQAPLELGILKRIMKVRAHRAFLFSGQSMVSGQPRAGVTRSCCNAVNRSVFCSVSPRSPPCSPRKFQEAIITSSRPLPKLQAARNIASRYAKWTPMFPGSHDKLVEQNAELDRSQVPRMNNEFDLLQSELANDLVPGQRDGCAEDRRQSAGHAALLPSVDSRFSARLQPGLLRDVPYAAAGELAGAHRRSAGVPAATQSFCSTRLWRYRVHPPGGSQR